MQTRRVLLVFIVLTLAGGIAIGLTSAPGAWYRALIKPSFNPPDWIFAPVWTVLYVLIAIAGARTWVRGRDGSLWMWFVQIALNFLWSPIFFRAHDIGLALTVILALLAAILLFIMLSWRRDRLAALLFVPYAVWVAFASILNAAIWRLN